MTTRSEYVGGLRALADLLDAQPDLPLPDNCDVSWYLFSSALRPMTFAEQKREAARIVRLLPGRQDKLETGDLFRLRGRIHGLKTQVIVDRPAVCERVVTGTAEVTREVPDPDAPTVSVTETVETVEWRCAPLLAEASA